MADSLGYPFRAIPLIEVKYQPDKDAYHIHSHYGCLTHLNIHKIRKLWNQAWLTPVKGEGTLTVKYPRKRDKHGNYIPNTAEYQTPKTEFIRYISEARVKQPLRVPQEVYFHILKNRQLIKCIGFSKDYLATVTTIREKQQKEFLETHVYLCTFPIEKDLTQFRDRFRYHFNKLFSDPSNSLSPAENCHTALISATEDINYDLCHDVALESRAERNNIPYETHSV